MENAPVTIVTSVPWEREWDIREFLRYGNSFPPTFPEDLLAHASPKDWPIISPVLFTIFTNEFTINEDNFRLFKYADDMALVGLLDKTNQTYDLAYLTHKKFKKSFIPNAVRIINSATFNWAVCKAWTVFLLYVYVTSYCVFICMSLFCCVGEPKIIFHLGGQ